MGANKKSYCGSQPHRLPLGGYIAPISDSIQNKTNLQYTKSEVLIDVLHAIVIYGSDFSELVVHPQGFCKTRTIPNPEFLWGKCCSC